VPAQVLIEWCELSPPDRYPFVAASCQLFDSGKGEGDLVAVSQTAGIVLRHAPDKLAVLNEFVNRFRPRSWSGSRAEILERRFPLLQSLNPDNDPELAKFIARAEIDLRKLISEERRYEAREEQDDAGFE